MSLPNWLHSIIDLAPLILAATPAAPLAPFVAAGIQAAEHIPGADGPTKLAIAKQIVSAGVAATNAQIGHQEIDPLLVDKLSTDAINVVVGVANLKHASAAEDVPPVSPLVGQ